MAEAASTPGTAAGYPRDQILATVYGQAVGDAIGLLTEFLTKEEAKEKYRKVERHLELEHKNLSPEAHRKRFKEGDWTDDTDQMILILQSLTDNDGQVKPEDFAEKLKFWSRNGFPELGDLVGHGIGTTTAKVMSNPEFVSQPHKAAFGLWDRTGRKVASNGAVMRTSILGIHRYWDTDAVADNAIAICKTTHYDPRCQASTVAVSVAISLMLRRQPQYLKKNGNYDIDKIIQECFHIASSTCLEADEQKKELKKYLKCKKIKDLELCEERKIGYTYKCLGCGFWALKQKDFRKALQTIVMEGGDADTNGAVAGALLGCKLGMPALPVSWVSKLIHKDWLDEKLERFLKILVRIKDGKATYEDAGESSQD
ncbi:ADP-ribosyl-[dinitrogen reductase] glycohydrolase-like [Haliotis asinina]|uniref:ADP-ribosyl-[dinitrogen reductase] glycohydrolase-like n=1 Tax=Haliotis asinina TaxID=109174 RepID=UPI00353253E5